MNPIIGSLVTPLLIQSLEDYAFLSTRKLPPLFEWYVEHHIRRALYNQTSFIRNTLFPPLLSNK